MVGDHVARDKSQGGVVAVAVADTHTDPERDSAGEGVVPVVGREQEVPVSSFVPYLDSACPNPDQVVEGERHVSETAV